MAAWRNLAILVTFLAAARAGWGQTYPLTESVKANDCFQIHLAMRLSGDWHVQREDQTKPIHITAEATHEFPERVLLVGPTGLPSKTARLYQSVQASISTQLDSSSKPSVSERT